MTLEEYLKFEERSSIRHEYVAGADVELIVDQPSLIVEVTSPSTRATDRREKLDAYMRIASLHHYLIVEQRRKHVIVYTRDSAGEWQRGEPDEEGDIAIDFLHCRLSLAQIYEDVTLPPLKARERLRARRVIRED